MFRKKKKQPELADTAFQSAFDKPAVIKESLLKPVKCWFCHSTFAPMARHLETDFITIDKIKKAVRCPVCNATNEVDFVEVTDEELQDM